MHLRASLQITCNLELKSKDLTRTSIWTHFLRNFRFQLHSVILCYHKKGDRDLIGRQNYGGFLLFLKYLLRLFKSSSIYPPASRRSLDWGSDLFQKVSYLLTVAGAGHKSICHAATHFYASQRFTAAKKGKWGNDRYLIHSKKGSNP